MMKLLILLTLSINLSWAKTRFTDEDRKKFLDEVKQGVAAHKVDNKGNIDFEIIKPALYEELDVYYQQQKFTREEMTKMKQHYEEFSRGAIRNGAGDAKEKAFLEFVDKELSEINKSSVPKLKEGDVCNNWSCEDGLKCAPDPVQEDGKMCKKEGSVCKDDKDCCSQACSLDASKKKGVCEDVYRCYKPLHLGDTCMTNPVCGEGECLPFNNKTSGIGECTDRGRACKKKQRLLFWELPRSQMCRFVCL